MFTKSKSKESSFKNNGYFYDCRIEYRSGDGVAPYTLTVIEGRDLLILDSDFQSLQDSTGLDIFNDFDEIVKTDQFQDMVLNSSFWDLGYFGVNECYNW